MKDYETATVQFLLDGTVVPPAAAKVRFETGRWFATAALPRAVTHGKTVPLLGKGATRREALENLVQLANYRLAYDEESREIELARLASAAPVRSPWLASRSA
jgi:hypothetical protein